MKCIVLAALVLLTFSARAQKFEGTITWSVQYQVTDTSYKPDAMNMVFPKSFTLQFSKNNFLFTSEGGILPVEMLWLGETKKYYQINRAAKTYALLPADSSTRKVPAAYRPVVTKTNETATILGYSCNRYDIKFNADSSIHQIYWTTTALNIPSLRTLPGQSGQSMYYEGMLGLPLKMELISAQMKLVSEVTAITPGILPEHLFVLPPDYKQEKTQTMH